jgi:hypothetical protein
VWENKVDLIDAKIAKYIVFSKQKKNQLQQCIEFVHKRTDSMNKNVYNFGKSITLSGGLLSNVINGQPADTKAFKILHEQVLVTPVPQFSLKAADVMKLTGLTQGPALGDVLKKVEAWWLENDTAPDHKACLDYVKKLAG